MTPAELVDELLLITRLEAMLFCEAASLRNGVQWRVVGRNLAPNSYISRIQCHESCEVVVRKVMNRCAK